MSDGNSAAAIQKHTNKILNRLEKGNAAISNQLEGQSAVLAAGMTAVQNQIAEQTKALGAIEIIKGIAEMDATLGLIDLEESYITDENLDDLNEVKELKQYFSTRFDELQAARDRQVHELILPAATILDKDLRSTLEERMSGIVPLLRECFEVTKETVNEREETMKQVIMKTQQTVEAFIQQRKEVRSAVSGVQIDYDTIRDVGSEGVAMAVPFYLVEVVDPSGSTTTEVHGPSTISELGDDLSGIELRPIPGFDRVLSAFRDRLPNLKGLFGGKTKKRSGSLEEALGKNAPAGIFAGWAANSMKKHMAARQVMYHLEGAVEDSMAEEYKKQVGTPAPRKAEPAASTAVEDAKALEQVAPESPRVKVAPAPAVQPSRIEREASKPKQASPAHPVIDPEPVDQVVTGAENDNDTLPHIDAVAASMPTTQRLEESPQAERVPSPTSEMDVPIDETPCDARQPEILVEDLDPKLDPAPEPAEYEGSLVETAVTEMVTPPIPIDTTPEAQPGEETPPVADDSDLTDEDSAAILEMAIGLIDGGEHAEALAILDDLIAEGNSDSIVGLYRDLCKKEMRENGEENE